MNTLRAEAGAPKYTADVLGRLCVTTETITANGKKNECDNMVIRKSTYTAQSYSEIKANDKSTCLKAHGGNYGGGSECYIVQSTEIDN